MWIPDSVEHIEAAIARGDLDETPSFDVKRELPPTPKTNATVAIDIAAMTTAGGTILIGVGEDADKRPTVRNPIRLAGAAERIAQIVQTSIAEVPQVLFRPYPLPSDASLGFLLVIVPPSPRAPHQVIVGDDRRFYGRGAKGNRRLPEQELALLYARRERLQVDLDARLEEVVRTTPYRSGDDDYGHIYAFVQPVPPDQSIWDAATVRAGGVGALQEQLSRATREVIVQAGVGGSFGGHHYWFPVGAEAMRMAQMAEDPPRDDLIDALCDITLNFDGRAVLFSGGVVRRVIEGAGDTTGQRYIYEDQMVGNLAALLAFAGALFGTAAYYGAVDVGVLVTNLAGALSIGWGEVNARRYSHPLLMWRDAPAFNGGSFNRKLRLASSTELEDPGSVATSLLRRLLTATTGSDAYDPLGTNPEAGTPR
jgi:hypothetical protein